MEGERKRAVGVKEIEEMGGKEMKERGREMVVELRELLGVEGIEREKE